MFILSSWLLCHYLLQISLYVNTLLLFSNRIANLLIIMTYILYYLFVYLGDIYVHWVGCFCLIIILCTCIVQRVGTCHYNISITYMERQYEGTYTLRKQFLNFYLLGVKPFSLECCFRIWFSVFRSWTSEYRCSSSFWNIANRKIKHIWQTRFNLVVSTSAVYTYFWNLVIFALANYSEKIYLFYLNWIHTCFEMQTIFDSQFH